MKGPKLLIWGFIVVFAIALGLAVSRPAQASRTDIGNAELRTLQTAGARLVDVRTPAEFDTAHIPGAVNVPVENITANAESWDKSLPIVVYCATGARSLNAAQWLVSHGFTKVYNLTAGIAAWDGDVTRGSSAAPASSYKAKASALPVMIDFFSPT